VKVRRPNTLSTQDAITTQAPVTVHMAGRMVRGRVSADNHAGNPVMVILLPGGCATTMPASIVMDAIHYNLILNW